MTSRPALEKVARELRGEFSWNEPLSGHTSLKVGGPVDLFIEPADLADLKGALDVLLAERVPYLVIGGGYNLLVKDGGVRGCAISLRALDHLRALPGDSLEVGAGVRNSMLATVASENGLSGVEFLAAIPGTFGGALAMNAGAHGGEILNRVVELETLTAGEQRRRKREELDFGYRYLKLEPGELVVGATLSLKQDDRLQIENRMAEFQRLRAGQRVGFPNAGSFFKNPPGSQAWRLIDGAGLRGMTLGGAQVSEVHTNFLVNRGGARAIDFLGLAALVKQRVKETSGIELEEEVRIIGEE